MSKKFSIIALIFALYVAIASTATAFAASDTIMMYGKTTPVLTNGINNAGNIWFQNDGATVYLANDASQQPHLTPDPSTPGGYKVEGWAWSDNLGWVSFSCRGGKNPQITGAACGAFDYGVKIDASGVFHGYAWNDAMGYMSMNSENHVPPALDGLGKPIVYGLKMTTTGAISGYAWSQSLGWLDFGGVYGRIKIKVSPIINTPEKCPSGNAVGLCGCFGSDGDPSGDPSKLNPALDAGVPGAVKVADGFDKYVLSLYFKDENGVEITKFQFDKGDYEAKVFFNWEDRVRREQTKKDTLSYNGDKVAYPFKVSDSKGAVISKPVLLYTTATSVAADILFGDVSSNETGTLENSKEALAAMTFNISSVAPTSKANVSKIEGKTGVVSNDDLSLVPGFADASLFKDANRLKLTSIEWVILNKNTGVTINGTSSFDPEHGTLEFKPALEISKMTGGLDKNTLWMFRNVPVGVKIAVKNNKTKPEDGTIKQGVITTLVKLIVSQSLENKFDTGFTAFTTKWIDEINADKEVPDIATGKDIKTPFSTFTPQLGDNFKLEASIPDLGDLPGNYSEGAGLYSVMEYYAYASNPPKLVTYFSNHLPRTISAGVANPSVVIQGTTYSQGNEVSSPQAGVSITGIGDQNVNIVRDLVFENIQKLLIDQKLPDSQEDPVTIASLNPPSCTLLGGCLKIQLEKERIFYFDTPNLILNSGDGTDILPADMNTVIIVSGGDIHIESNLYTADPTQKKNKLGLIALRESDLGEGNFYISPFVTNIQALMIADGTMFSAPEGLFKTIDGEPKDPIDPAVFNRQLVIEGGVSSRNCIGCVDSAKEFYYIPTRGPLSTDDVANKETAKKYDLNYLRYFSPSILYNDAGNPVDMKCGQALEIDQLQSPPAGCNGVTPTKMYDAITGDGDLVIQDEKTIAEGVKYDKKTADGKEVFFTKTSNPVYIKYVPPSADSFVFSKNKSLTF